MLSVGLVRLSRKKDRDRIRPHKVKAPHSTKNKDWGSVFIN